MNVASGTAAADALMTEAGQQARPEHSGRRHSALEHLLSEVLGRLGWQRDPAVFDSALPPQGALDTLDDASMLLNGLCLPSEVGSAPPRTWLDGGDGAVVALCGEEAVAMARINGQEITLASLEAPQSDIRKVLGDAGRVLFIYRSPEPDRDRITRDVLLRRLRHGLRTGLVLSFFIHVVALLVPLFTMAVFDRVLGVGAAGSLLPVLSGAALAVACVALLRLVRARYLAAQHARLATLAGAAAEARLLSLPLRAVFAQSRESIETRITAARRGADVFASSNTAAVFDAPFVLLSIVMIGLLGGILVLVPALYLLLMMGVALLVSRDRSGADPMLAQAGRERAAMLHEVGVKAPEIMENRLGAVWLGRLAEQAAHAARGSYTRGLRSAGIMALGAILGTGAALATLAVGVWLAIGGTITSGALVATMLLTWRITGPAQALFIALPRLRSIRLALRSLETPVAGELESAAPVALQPVPRRAPQIDVKGAYFRYDAETEPALNNVSFSVSPGSVNVIIGANGAGKTTLLRLLSGGLAPQSGQVLLDGVTLRQYDPAELALASLILPALAERGSGAGVPWALSEAGTWSPRATIDAVLAGELAPPDRPAPTRCDPVLVLLDDPTGCADRAERDSFLAFLRGVRGHATVFFSTHDLSLVPAADNAIYLDDGLLRHFGPARRGEGNEQGAA